MITVQVSEASGVAEARRRTVDLARSLGFDETEAGKVAISVTELATNLVRHGGGGTIVARRTEDEDEDGCALNVLSLDRGPGMADVQACLSDGFSTAGTQGTGLGAIQRQSSELDIYSRPGLGTAILARFRRGRDPAPGGRPLGHPAAARPAALVSTGGISVPKPGEEACGDAWGVDAHDGDVVMLVADGLGHGPIAAAASREAVRIFRRHARRPVPEILAALHEGLRPTRGAAVAVARIDVARGQVAYGGVGNIAAAIVVDGQVRRLVSHNGTAGVTAPRIQEFIYPISRGGILIMHSDGVGTGFAPERYPGLLARDPELVAGVLYRDLVRGRDDATVAAARLNPS